jgi:arylformamidase
MMIHDISMSIFHEMPVYKGKKSKRPIISIDSNFDKGSVYETRLEMNMHTGTHLDAPLHIFAGGSTLEALDLKRVVTKCRVLDFKHVADIISESHLVQKNIGDGEFIILKTRNSFENILEGEYVYLDEAGAKYLRSKNVTGVGIDALSIERAHPEHETHKVLLDAGIVILEGLKLDKVNEGEYLLVAAPIKLVGTEAAPVRALLISEYATGDDSLLSHKEK